MSERSLTFDAIYKRNAWNGTETRSGPGSNQGATKLVQRFLPAFMEGVGAHSILDASCGIANWMPDLPGYIGCDVSSAAVQASRKRFPKRDYRLLDICSDVLPRVDVIFCRDAIQHLSLREGVAAISNFRRSGATWLVLSTHEGGRNRNVPTGSYYEPDMEAAPFSLGAPWMVIEDGFWDHGLQYPNKYLGVWACV